MQGRKYKIAILDEDGKVVKETAELKSEEITLIGVSMWRGAEEMGNGDKIAGVMDTFRAATRELTERESMTELESSRRAKTEKSS